MSAIYTESRFVVKEMDMDMNIIQEKFIVPAARK